MPYDSVITRTDAEALIPEEVSREIIQSVPEASAVMSMARRLPNMSRKQQRLPILSALIEAYFVAGDTGLKQTSKAAWDNKYIIAEELAVIVPIPETVLDDADYDIWGEVQPRIVEAFGRKFDAAVLHGEDAPATWPSDLMTGATAAGHVIARGSVGADVYDDLMSENGLFSLVEEDGYDVTGHVAALRMRSILRGLRDANGQPIFVRTIQDRTRYELDGSPMTFPKNGGIDPTAALLFSGDWDQLVYSMRTDITYKMLTEAVLTDSGGTVVFNLAQQDMVALRAVMRLGWQLPNPINRVNPEEGTRYPFAVLTPAL